jgi:hypothetical protein
MRVALQKICTPLKSLLLICTVFLAEKALAVGDTPPGDGGAGGGLSYRLKNPLTGFPTIQDLFLGILDVIIVIATPIVVIFIIFAGFKYVTAKGNPSKIQEANNALMYAIIGGILIIGARAIALIIKNLVNSFA